MAGIEVVGGSVDGDAESGEAGDAGVSWCTTGAGLGSCDPGGVGGMGGLASSEAAPLIGALILNGSLTLV
ncbi:MAG: hypothetical protein ACRDP1_07420 [Nocardioidaceae bacterium]